MQSQQTIIDGYELERVSGWMDGWLEGYVPRETGFSAVFNLHLP